MGIIEDRRSIRHYKEGNIDKDTILKILDSGRLAPSAKNRQPWYFVVLNSDLKDKVADLMTKYYEGHKNDNERIMSVINTARVIKESSVLILIFKNNDIDWLINDTLSIGACVENMCLKATELNIGSLWIGDTMYVEDEIKKLVNKEDMSLSCALSLGISNCNPKQRPRKELNEIVEWL